MKPKIFLSHSKKDKDFILKLNEHLRLARIEGWYDDWEIPPGESIRRKIFEEGLPSCDIFFVYLTDNAIDSYWVKNELDSMFTIESENKYQSLIIPFVDSDATRNQLSVDLKSRNIPVLNQQVFTEPLCKLIARSWEVFNKKQLNIQREYSNSLQLQLQKQVLELENKILQLQLSGNTDIKIIQQKIQSISYTDFDNEIVIPLDVIFKNLSIILANGSQRSELYETIQNIFKYTENDLWYDDKKHKYLSTIVDEIIGKLIILGLVHKIILINKSMDGSDYTKEDFTLTPLGIKVLNETV